MKLARVLAATIPSGDATVVRMRQEVIDLINVPEHFPVLPADWVTQVFDGSNLERPWPAQYVYVGLGACGSGVNPSPWALSSMMQIFLKRMLVTVLMY